MCERILTPAQAGCCSPTLWCISSNSKLLSEIVLCPTAEIQPHPGAAALNCPHLYPPTKLALPSYFPKHLNTTHAVQHDASHPILSDLLVGYANHETIFPGIWFCRPTGFFRGNSRYGQTKIHFSWRINKFLVDVLGGNMRYCLCGETVLGKACVAS